MNLCLFRPEEVSRPLPLQDPRAEHVLKVLRRRPGDTFDAGLLNGPRGKARIAAVHADRLDLEFSWGATPPLPPDVRLWIGLPRPQTARKVLSEATAAGVREIHFFASEKGEPSYGTSTLWTSGEWRRHLVAGAEQAFCTHLPHVTWNRSLQELAGELPDNGSRLALDVYEATGHLAQVQPEMPVVLALGAERGWSAGERELLRSRSFALVHLGSRVLRVETATTFSLGMLAGLALNNRHKPIGAP
ncbi:MAG: RsmE family RNA methyltransferase [Opitutaceae bacterium]|nr:RsmE family RNA methyltransferase [Opitutaceae bacterium]